MAVVTLHGHRHREVQLPPVSFDPREELPEPFLGVGDGKLVQELSVWGSDPHMMGLAAYVHRDTDHGVHHGAPPFGVSSSVSRRKPRATPQRAAPSRWTLAG